MARFSASAGAAGFKDMLVRAKLTACGVPCPKATEEPAEGRTAHPAAPAALGDFHTFRHTWATWLRRYGGADVQGLSPPATGAILDRPRATRMWSRATSGQRVEKLPSIERGKDVETQKTGT